MVTETPLPLATRLWFAFVCFWRVLTDPSFAGRAMIVRDALPAPEPVKPEPVKPEPVKPEPVRVEPVKAEPVVDAAAEAARGAMQLLAMLQREGRLVDFLEEDLGGASDADVGAAARTVHDGCRKALRGSVTLAPVRPESEGARVRVESGYDAGALKLTGALRGQGPYEGTLAHRGWRVQEVKLPQLLPGADARVVAPAEVAV